ncbi:1-deoxy-D-xylulose-5-phosphate reductoisomerase [Persicobacter psychrovividus]|uniref:1-deoxy-D-xylulose 5-phosphate reductoisomerase n=1 Tax=Persicobacter psychrovividus TaxID=387638 RepID=A0ABN6L9Z0_9BACT|nr:1-deoxy-D-xylulose 5-phosphate reductoisomerase [Persicobacter psychrovividus]
MEPLFEKKRHIAILGSTGSIGTQTLEVIAEQPQHFQVEVLTARRNVDLLIKQSLQFKPNAVVISEESLYEKAFEALDPHGIKVYAGQNALNAVVQMEEIDIVLTALVGYSGVLPTIKAIEAGKHIALANKETLVVAGEIITELAQQHRVSIFPVDSEHSAIFQCLVGEHPDSIEKLILTASGGPFRGMKTDELRKVTKAQALKHPNWDMGAKVTIDSASLMNKGLEVIEAKWLFGVDVDQIDVVVHPQSIVHSMVQFKDSSIKAQLGLPDMRLPIQYAIGFPHRLPCKFERLNFMDYPTLTFEKPDMATFRNLGLAFEAIKAGGNMPCILNAANEIAVQAFLEDKIGFLNMSDLIENCMQKATFIAQPTLDDLIATDKSVRNLASELL